MTPPRATDGPLAGDETMRAQTNHDRISRLQSVEPKGKARGQWRTRRGVLVSVQTRDDAGIDGDAPWVASCLAHGEHLCCSTKRAAIRSAQHTEEWCSLCMAH